jgi:hypothetical protein
VTGVAFGWDPGMIATPGTLLQSASPAVPNLRVVVELAKLAKDQLMRSAS